VLVVRLLINVNIVVIIFFPWNLLGGELLYVFSAVVCFFCIIVVVMYSVSISASSLEELVSETLRHRTVH